jgi:class 3 adenylate cyclase
VSAGGVVTVMTDIGDQKLAERKTAEKEAQFHLALDNMPGALVYTDADLDIVFCNDRFREMYPAPAELLQSGRPYPGFLRWLAENGYYGPGDRDALVARRVESLRNPSDRSFEDRTPDNRFYRIMRRRVDGDGAVTVMTDITDQKQAEQQLLEEKDRTEQANDQVTEKNRMLEGLSFKLSKDAKACVRMALAMQRRVRDLEYEWRSRGLERPFRIRMGICTGFCTVGNFGSQDRMDYTIIGNEVNLAARLQTLAEPGGILLSHETNALVSDIVLCEEQPPITVKGFVRPVNTYKVVGTYDDLVETGRVVLKERDGLRVLVDLARQSRPEAIAILEEILTQLKN